jgi:thymidylate kinase
MELLKRTHVIKELDVNGYKMLLEQTLDFPYFGFFLDAGNMDIIRRMKLRGTKNNGLILSGVINTRVNTAKEERRIFNELRKSHPNHNIHFVDANQDVDGVYKQVTSIIKQRIPAMSL